MAKGKKHTPEQVVSLLRQIAEPLQHSRGWVESRWLSTFGSGHFPPSMASQDLSISGCSFFSLGPRNFRLKALKEDGYCFEKT